VISHWENIIIEMKSIDPDLLDEVMKTPSPIHAAIKTKQLLLVQHIVNTAANTSNPLNLNECGGGATWPPLHTAVFASTPDIVAYLIESGADVNLTHGGNVTPLYFACSCGNVDIARVLITHGADLNVKDECGDSPLKMAAIGNHLDTVDLLIASGADVTHITQR